VQRSGSDAAEARAAGAAAEASRSGQASMEEDAAMSAAMEPTVANRCFMTLLVRCVSRWSGQTRRQRGADLGKLRPFP
jgi:hypothetical protein